MNFFFQCSTRYLASERKFCLKYKYTNDKVFDEFPKVPDHFPKIFEGFQNFSEG